MTMPMNVFPNRVIHAIAAVVDIANHTEPVNAKEIAERLNLPPRRLETSLQALVHAGILKGQRGPRGGYVALSKDTPLSVIVKIVAGATDTEDQRAPSPGVEHVLKFVGDASDAALNEIGKWTVAYLVAGMALRKAEDAQP